MENRRSIRRSIAQALVCFIGFAFPLGAAAANNVWIEVRSPHFRVLSDGGDRDARAVAGRFEQMRMAFATAMPWLRLDPPVPLLILAPRDEDSLKSLLPEMWKQKNLKPGGFFAGGSEKSFAVIRLDVVRRQSQSQPSGDGYQVAYHEYTHSVLNANFPWLPLWLDEGLAEFFGNTQFDRDRIYLGAPNIRADYTRGLPLVPLGKLMGMTLTSPEYRDANQVQVFYSESWGLVHWLLVSPEMERGKRLQRYVTSLDNGDDPAEAFRKTIGDFNQVEEQLHRYLDRTSLDVLTFNNPSPVNADAFPARQLTPAESNAELGTVEVWLRENTAARRRLEQALNEAPHAAIAAEALAFLKLGEGKDAEARALFERALADDDKLYLSAYYRAVLPPVSEARAGLNRVVELNPEFAPALVQLALSFFREGKFESAIGPALKAQQLRPARAGYHLLIGEILYALGRDNEAASVARYVADRWPDMYNDAAVELWQKLPAQSRKGPELVRKPLPPGMQVIRGIVTSVTCREKDQTMRIVIDGKAWTFRAENERIRFGLGDTVWYGPDHFNRCHHLDGLRAVIQYTSSSTAGIAGNVVEFKVYDNFK